MEAERKTAPRRRILIAEDEPNVRQLLARTLEALSYDVLQTPNGRAAFDIVMLHRVDLVLTDIRMPELDGIRLLRQLKSNPATRDIPVIVISSQDDLSSVVECIEQGAEDHISKPYHSAILEVRVRAALERKSMRDAEQEQLRRVVQLAAVAEAAERGEYVAGTLDALARESDALGRLAQSLDRMILARKTR
jgi:adenylate cyclase